MIVHKVTIIMNVKLGEQWLKVSEWQRSAKFASALLILVPSSLQLLPAELKDRIIAMS